MPRRLYFIDFPLLLMAAGLLGWIFPNDALLAVTSFVGAAIGGYTLWAMLVRRSPLRISHLICVANIVGYGFGALNSWLTLERNGLGLATFLNKDTQAVTEAMGAVLISAAVLYTLGEIYEKPIFGHDFHLTFDSRSLMLIFSGSILMFVGYVTHSYGFMGASAGEGHVSLLGAFLAWFCPALFAFTFVAFMNWHGKWTKRMLGIVLATQFLMVVPTGRRSLLYTVILAVLAMQLGEYRPKWSLIRKVVYVSAGIIFISVGATAFFYLRAAKGKIDKQNYTYAEWIHAAYQLYNSGESTKINADLKENLKKRTFVLGFLADLLDASFRMQPALGADAIHEFQLIIPSAFWGNKDTILYQEELIADQQFNFSFGDEANSILTAGALDFGFWGMVIYPILLWGLFRLFIEFFCFTLPTTSSAFITLALAMDALATEMGLTGHLAAVRNAIIFSIVLTMIIKLPKFSLRHATNEQKVVL